MPTRTKLAALAISLPLFALVGVAGAQQPAGDTDTDYAALAMTAAPPEVAHDATIVRLMNGAVQTLKKGDNEYTCMVGNEGPMCMGPIAMEWVRAWQSLDITAQRARIYLHARWGHGDEHHGSVGD